MRPSSVKNPASKKGDRRAESQYVSNQPGGTLTLYSYPLSVASLSGFQAFPTGTDAGMNVLFCASVCSQNSVPLASP